MEHKVKRIIAKSTAFYRGVFIFEVGKDAFVIYLWIKKYEFETLTEVTAFIDAWHVSWKLN